MVRLIVFLIRRRLGLGKYELFRFDNQKSIYDCYYFSTHGLKKVHRDGLITQSNVRLNWLLDDNCKITPVEDSEVVGIVFRMQTYAERKLIGGVRYE